MSCAGVATSIMPEAIAVCGMLGYFGAVPSAVCAMVMPPRSLTALAPSVPSPSLPDRITATARSPASTASELRNRSMGFRSRLAGRGRISWKRPSAILSEASSGMT